MLKKLITTFTLTALAALTLIPSVLASGTNTYCDFPFVDLNGHWAFHAVEELFCRGVVEGRSYYYYEPFEKVTRAEFVKMALLNAGEDPYEYEGKTEPYKDVREDDWFHIYIVAGYELGLIHYNEYFRPNDPINRAEAVTMLVRHADAVASENHTDYKDVDLNMWYSVYIHAATNYGVVEGYPDSTFRPGNDVTRDEAAVMVSNAFEAWYE